MKAMNVGVVGSGIVGQTLADGLLKHGYAVMRGSRNPAQLTAWAKAAGANASVGTPAETARFGEVVVLAVKGLAAEATVSSCGPALLAGKLVIDTTNPIAEAPIEQGVLRFFTEPNESLMERLVTVAPEAHFVKAFSSVGAGSMVNPDFGAQRPTMFICGANAEAKAQTSALLSQFGWDTEDMGGPPAARAIEPLCMLWCIPGFLRNEWSHAFKLLRPV